jgi:hypothetical protein
VREVIAHSVHTRRAANNLDSINVIHCNALRGKGINKVLACLLDALELRRRESLQISTGDFALDVLVLHEALNAHDNLASREAHLLLDLLALDFQTNAGAGVGANVKLVSGLDVVGEVVEKGKIKVTSTKGAIA